MGARPQTVLVSKYSIVTSNGDASSSKLPAESPANADDTQDYTSLEEEEKKGIVGVVISLHDGELGHLHERGIVRADSILCAGLATAVLHIRQLTCLPEEVDHVITG